MKQVPISDTEQRLFTLEEQLFAAVSLLDDFLQIGPDVQKLTGHANEVERFFRRYDFESILPNHPHFKPPTTRQDPDDDPF